MVKKINSCSNAVRVIALICRIFLVIAFISLLILAVILFVIPRGTFMWHGQTLNDAGAQTAAEDLENRLISMLGDELPLLGESIAAGGDITDCVWLLFPILADFLCFYLVLLFLGGIAKKLAKADKPFSCGAEKQIIALGVALLASAIISSAVSSVSTALFESTLGRFAFNLKLNFSLVSVIYIVGYAALYYLYKYGGSLEKAACQAASSSAPVSDMNTSPEKPEVIAPLPVCDEQSNALKLTPQPLEDYSRNQNETIN